MNNVDPIGLQKAILWEEAKGKLRALVIAGGQGQNRSPNWQTVSDMVEGFIREFERLGYQE